MTSSARDDLDHFAMHASWSGTLFAVPWILTLRQAEYVS